MKIPSRNGSHFLIILIIGLLLGVWSHHLFSVARMNIRNVQVVQQVDVPHDEIFGRLIFRRSITIGTTMSMQTHDSCFAEWQSRLWASYDLYESANFLLANKNCPRFPEDTLIWRGNLAWLMNERELAQQYWIQVSDDMLLAYAKNLLLGGEKQVGEAIVELLNLRAANKNTGLETGRFFSALADLYRYSGQESESFRYYLLSWESGQRSYRQAYHLGRGLAQNDQCEKAVLVFEEGLEIRGLNNPGPLLKSDYFQILGTCYAKLGRVDDAKFAYAQSREILLQAQNLLKTDTLLKRLENLNSLESSLID